MQTLVPPVVGRNSEPFDCGREVLHLGGLLFEGQPRYEVLHPVGDRKVGVAEGIFLSVDRQYEEAGGPE